MAANGLEHSAGWATSVARRCPVRVAGLSAREWEVLGLLADGFTNRGIAVGLHVNVKTVESTVRSVFEKLRLPNNGVANRRVLAVLAYLAESEVLASPSAAASVDAAALVTRG